MLAIKTERWPRFFLFHSIDRGKLQKLQVVDDSQELFLKAVDGSPRYKIQLSTLKVTERRDFHIQVKSVGNKVSSNTKS
jgi:hypothetical protein